MKFWRYGIVVMSAESPLYFGKLVLPMGKEKKSFFHYCSKTKGPRVAIKTKRQADRGRFWIRQCKTETVYGHCQVRRLKNKRIVKSGHTLVFVFLQTSLQTNGQGI